MHRQLSGKERGSSLSQMRADQFLRQLDHRGHIAEVNPFPPGVRGGGAQPCGNTGANRQPVVRGSGASPISHVGPVGLGLMLALVATTRSNGPGPQPPLSLAGRISGYSRLFGVSWEPRPVQIILFVPDRVIHIGGQEFPELPFRPVLAFADDLPPARRIASRVRETLHAAVTGAGPLLRFHGLPPATSPAQGEHLVVDRHRLCRHGSTRRRQPRERSACLL
jgi:hypothetical protein